MKKTLSTIVLALGLAFSAVPAFATNGDPGPAPTPVCGHNGTDLPDGPCWPEACGQYAAPEYASLGETGYQLRTAFARISEQQATISAQRERISHLRAVVRRLRHQR